MKKFILLIVLFILAGLLLYKLLSEKNTQKEQTRDQALRINKNSNAFNTAFAQLMSEYFSMKDALVGSDTLKADQAAYALALRVDSLPLRQLKADTAILLTAKSLAAGISGEARDFSSGPGIDGRRTAFNGLTNDLYNLIRTVRYDRETIYHIRCPMAFKDSGQGFWLSNTPTIVNPYLGNKDPKMASCGEINDSVDFAEK
jgi:hypothetical protein